MQRLPIVLPAPHPTADKALQKTHSKLQPAVASLQAARENDHAQYEALSPSHRSEARRQALKRYQLELSTLERELPVLTLLVNEYQPANLKLFEQAQATADEIQSLAWDTVVGDFRKQYGERWAISEASLNLHAANHPIVRGAVEKLTERKAERDREQDWLNKNRQVLTLVERRLRELHFTLAAAQRQADMEQRQADEVAQARQAQDARGAAERERDEKREAEWVESQKKIAADARKSLGL